MYEFKILVTALRADIDGQFKGVITFKHEEESKSFNY